MNGLGFVRRANVVFARSLKRQRPPGRKNRVDKDDNLAWIPPVSPRIFLIGRYNDNIRKCCQWGIPHCVLNVVGSGGGGERAPRLLPRHYTHRRQKDRRPRVLLLCTFNDRGGQPPFPPNPPADSRLFRYEDPHHRHFSKWSDAAGGGCVADATRRTVPHRHIS